VIRARCGGSRKTGSREVVVKLPKFDGSMSWAMFAQFDAVTGHNASAAQEMGQPTDTLHSVPATGI
jgi:hypothetical protein